VAPSSRVAARLKVPFAAGRAAGRGETLPVFAVAARFKGANR
jgi:hypothetical protein